LGEGGTNCGKGKRGGGGFSQGEGNSASAKCEFGDQENQRKDLCQELKSIGKAVGASQLRGGGGGIQKKKDILS